MKLRELAPLIGCEAGRVPDVAISGVTEDSRKVAPGFAFVAAPGEHTDGHDYAEQARSKGAVVILGERTEVAELAGLPYLCVGSARRSLGILAHRLAGDPSHSMTVIGVTGTNGKTSTTYLIQRVLEHCGYTAATFGTLGYFVKGESLGAKHTTPFGEDLAEIFQRAREAGCTHVVMEASSHALDQDRVAGIRFEVGVFTNLTQDHLDYHPDMEAYFAAKRKLFESLDGPNAFGVINTDDPYGPRYVEACPVRTITFGKKGDCKAQKIEVDLMKSRFHLKSPWGERDIETNLLGRHNVANALGAIAVCGGLGLPLDRIGEGIGSLQSVPGRFERVDAGQDFQVIVDYAHTEDGLRNVLQAARKICSKNVIVVFGCGGDRDKTKRPKMAAAVAELGDFAIVTSDNPRTEDPRRILLDVEVGMQHSGKHKGEDYLVIEDRAAAIAEAIARAREGDLVMIAGKGHEDYQIFGTEKIHFDDREVARDVLTRRTAG